MLRIFIYISFKNSASASFRCCSVWRTVTKLEYFYLRKVVFFSFLVNENPPKYQSDSRQDLRKK